MKKFTTEETIARVWDVEEIKKLMSRRVFYQANEWREKEIDELWVSDPELQKTASFGRNTGYYVGMDAIRAYYVDKHNAEMGEGVGYLTNHPITTGLVREAEDGKTAKGMWYSIAQETRPQADGTGLALWMPEKIGVDFVKEADGWKIWHIIIANDLVCEAGTNNELDPVYVDFATDPVAVEFGTPTIQKLVHDQTFNWWDNYPPMPQAYETWSDDISYGPEGYHESETFQFGAKGGHDYK
jgi:hypothetical protein